MARSFVYNRPLDAKILLDPENPNHEFQFNTILEIKKEVESDPFETEAGLSSEETVTSSSGLYVDPNHELQSADALNQDKESEDSAHPKLVIKFRDLWKKSEQNVDNPKKRRKSRNKGSTNESTTVAKPKNNKRHKPGLGVSSKNRTTRSSLLEQRRSDSKAGNQSTADHSEQESTSDKEDKQDVWNFGRITRLKKNLNILCESCGMCFRSNQRLQAHKRYYTADGEYHCATCDIRFNRRFQLSRHVKIAHSSLGDEDNYKFKCHLCIDRFEKKASLIAHVTHLHNKHVVTHKRNTNKEVLASLPSSHVRRRNRRKRLTARKSKRVRNHIVAVNSDGQNTKANGGSHSIKNSNESVGILQKKDKQNDKHLHDGIIFNNDKVDTRSTQHLKNTNYSTHSGTLMTEKIDEQEALTQQQVHSPIKDSNNRPITPRDTRNRIETVPLNSRLQLSRKSRASPRLLERNEERHVSQHRNQEISSESLPENVQSRLTGDLVDQLGNKVGNWSVSKPLNQLDKTDHVSGCNSSSATVDLADIDPTTEIDNVLRRTRSSIPKTIFNTSSTNNMSLATHSDRQLTQNEDLSVQGQTLNPTKDSYATTKAHPRSEDLDDGLRLLPHHQQLGELQVGSVLSDQVSEEFKATEKSIKTDDDDDDDVSSGFNNFGIDLMQVDDFEGTYRSNFVDYENEEVSDGSCESMSLKFAASSSNASVADSLSLDNVNMLTSCNMRNDLGIRDVRVCLVKLENMLNLSTANDPPKSSQLENVSLVKTETIDCDPCEKESDNKLREWQHSRWQHNSGDVNLIQGSRSMIRRKRVIANPCRKLLSNKNGLIESRKVGRRGSKISVKHCFLCDAVFPSTFASATHYLSVHIEAGSLQCCICYSSFRNLGKLRTHLFKHYRLVKRKLQYACVVCRKQVRIPSVTRRCTECDRNYEEQFSNAQDLAENRSAGEKVSDSEDISDSQSEISPVPMSDDSEENNIVRVDHESVNDGEKVISPRMSEDEYKNFRCPACDCVFFESSLLNDHLLAAHGNVDRCESHSSQKIVKLRPQTLPHLKYRDYQDEPKNRRDNRSSLPKLSVGKKRHFESKNIRGHDKLCKKKSHTPQKLGFSQTNGKHQRLIQQHRVRGKKKTCSDHKCDVCGLNCCCRKSLKIHKKRYLTNGNNVCNICGLTFAWKHVLVMHMKTAHNPKIPFYGRVRCEICNQGFYNRKFLRIHLAHFHNIKYFQCRICRIRFDTSRSLDNHRRYYSENLNRRCGSCGESFKCKYMLEYHKAQVHNREKLKAYKYSCDVCNFAFLDELLLQAHIGHSHNMLDREAETNGENMVTEQLPENIQLNPVRPETDCIDSNVSTNIPAVREHVNEIQRARGIAEDVVGKTIRTHTSSEYKCGLCKLSFNDPYAILNHEWEFSNEGTYTCPLCNRRFMTDYLLKDHKMKHYQRNVVRKYECYICKEDFSKLDHLKMHGWHLHGPQFAWEKCTKSADIHDQSTSESRTNPDGGVRKNPVDDTLDTIGLVASNEILRCGKVRLFKKVSNNISSVELPRRHSNEDSYCCNFCKINFSSESLLEEHIERHIYRAYYTNSSRYLCLICKNKFRTNDILRAHVIHCHTAERKKPNLSKPGCSKDSIPSKPGKSRIRSTCDQAGINKVDSTSKNVAANSCRKRTIKHKPADSEKPNGNQQSNGTPPSKKRKLSNPTSEVDIVKSDRAHRTSVLRKVEQRTENELGCNYQGGGNDRNRNELKLTGSSGSGVISHVDPDSIPEEVKLFTVIVKDVKGLETHTCTICIETFYSVTEFRIHFTSVHVKNGAYLCTFCEKKFPVKSDLKSDVLKHEKETRNYFCCNKQFSSITEFVSHKLFHDGQAKEKQNKPNAQLSKLFEAGFFRESNKESTVDKTDNLYRCEICDKAFLDFKSVLKHWDTCIDTNGLQCDLCRATFKSLNSFRLHKTIHHEKKQFLNNTQNRRSCRLSGNRTDQASMQSSIVHDNKKLQRRTIHIPAKRTATVISNTVVTAANKIARQNELLKSGKITVKPFAKILPNFKNNNERQKTDTNDVTEPPRSELRTHQGEPSSKRSGVSKAAPRMISITNIGKSALPETRSNASIPSSTVSRPAKSITQTSDNVPRNASGDHILHHLPVKHSNKIIKRHSLPNNSGLRVEQNEHNEQRPAALQLNASSTAKNSGSSQSPVNSSIEIGNLRLESTTSSQKSRSNDFEVTKPLNLLSQSLNVGDSYYLCIQPAADSSDNINQAGSVTNDSGQKSQPNDGSRKILPSLIPIPLNTGTSPTYYLCVQPTHDNSPKSSTQTASLNDFKPKTPGSSYNVKKLPKLLESCSNIILNPINASDIQRIANNSNSKNTQNDSVMQPYLTSSKDTRVSALPATAGTSTSGNSATSKKIIMKGRNIPKDKSASNKELVLSKQVVRCTFCNLLFTEKAKLIKHMESHRAMAQENQCPACGLTFSNERALQQHLPEHKSSTCTKCDMITFFSDTVDYPRGVNKYCSVCNTVLPLPTRKLNRSATNSAQQVMRCGICMATFSASQMTVHFKMVHSSFVCGICEVKFSTKSSLLNHMQTHDTGSREPCQCKTCKKYFIRLSELAVHMLSHSTAQGI